MGCTGMTDDETATCCTGSSSNSSSSSSRGFCPLKNGQQQHQQQGGLPSVPSSASRHAYCEERGQHGRTAEHVSKGAHASEICSDKNVSAQGFLAWHVLSFECYIPWCQVHCYVVPCWSVGNCPLRDMCADKS